MEYRLQHFLLYDVRCVSQSCAYKEEKMGNQSRPPKNEYGDVRVGDVEQLFMLPKGSFRHESGRDQRSDTKLSTLRKKNEKKK